MATTLEGLKMLLWSIDPVIGWSCRVDKTPSRQTGVHKVGNSGVRLELAGRLTHDRDLSRVRPRCHDFGGCEISTFGWRTGSASWLAPRLGPEELSVGLFDIMSLGNSSGEAQDWILGRIPGWIGSRNVPVMQFTIKGPTRMMAGA
jgi:hypothetical protein